MKNKSAEVYIGLVVAIGIFLILAQTVVTLIFNVYDLVIFNRVRTTARYLAQEKLEVIKGTNYSDIGTVGGIPNGIFEQNETVVANGQAFEIYTRVNYIDDDFDGTGTSDVDPADYKKISLVVSWGGIGSGVVNQVNLSTLIAENGEDVTGGIIDITVSDSNGNPVSLAEVTITASSLTPPVNTTLFTNAEGKIQIPGAQECSSCYEVVVTKSGYSTDKTYNTSEVANPSKPNLTVVNGQYSEASFSIDFLSALNITSVQSRENDFLPLPNQQFILRGTKTIGTDTSSNIIYKYAEILQTDSGGNLEVNNLEWDSYEIVIPTGVGWDISGSNPLMPIIVNPNSNESIIFASATGSENRMLVKFTDGSGVPISSVAATLKENLTAIEASSSSGLETNPDFGQIFWGGLNNATYTIYATASGFIDFTKEIIVSDYTDVSAIMINQ